MTARLRATGASAHKEDAALHSPAIAIVRGEPQSFRYTADAMPEQEVEVEVNSAGAKHGGDRGVAVGLTRQVFLLITSKRFEDQETWLDLR